MSLKIKIHLKFNASKLYLILFLLNLLKIMLFFDTMQPVERDQRFWMTTFAV